MTVSNSYNHRSAYAHILSAIADICNLLPVAFGQLSVQGAIHLMPYRGSSNLGSFGQTEKVSGFPGLA